MNRVNRYIEVFKANGIKYNKDFEAITPSTSYPTAEVRNLVNNSMNLIKKCLDKGVNDGFDGKLRDYIFKLTDLSVKLRDSKNLKLLDGFKKEVRNMAIGETNKIDLTKPLKEWISSTKDGLDFCIQTNKEEVEVQSLKKGLSIINNIEHRLDSIVDKSSKKAYECAKQVQEVIVKFRNRIAAKDVNTLSIKTLEDAYPILDKWSELKSAISFFFNPACDPKLFEKEGYGYFKEDNFNGLTAHIYFVEKLENLKRNIEKQNKTLDNYYDTPVAKRIKATNEKLEELNKEEQDLDLKYNNGEISEAMYDQRTINLLRRKKQYETELTKYGQVEQKNFRLIEKKRSNLFNIERILLDIEMEQENLVVFNALANKLDLSSMDVLINGAADTPEQLEAATNNIIQIKAMVQAAIKEANQIFAEIDETINVLDLEELEEMDQEELEKQKQEEDEFAALLAKKKGKMNQKEEKVKQPEKQEKTNNELEDVLL